MKAAFAARENRIAPVFDVARQIHIVMVESGRIVGESQEILTGDMPTLKVLSLTDLEIDTLICGAISRPMEAMVSAYGIQVIGFVAGDLREVIQTWLDGRLMDDRFTMPGCRGRGRGRFPGMQNKNKEDEFMRGRKSGGGGSGGGQGQGQGRGGRRQGRMGGPLASGPGGNCMCLKCGYQEPHERGTPCTQKQCPKCGIVLTKQ